MDVFTSVLALAFFLVCAVVLTLLLPRFWHMSAEELDARQRSLRGSRVIRGAFAASPLAAVVSWVFVAIGVALILDDAGVAVPDAVFVTLFVLFLVLAVLVGIAAIFSRPRWVLLPAFRDESKRRAYLTAGENDD